ncbi:MAG: glycogen synthase GlgA [Candidatus Delongbacteria bacterium]|nr:glycogen synthase GlgA [Candidatus Delongbacteria bacterium]
MISPECVPLAKTGGLADVVGALPIALKRMGHDVRVVIPMYGSISQERYQIEPFMNSMGVWMGDTLEWCSVYKTKLSEGVPVYLIAYDNYFKRPGLYHDADFNDYQDNPRRFAFLTRAGLQLCRDIAFKPDILHIHDWQTALGSAYLKIWHWDDPILGDTASLLTIHNIGYQGRYHSDTMNYLGLGWSNFVPEKFEDFGQINMLKGGIYYADMVNTVSPTYARETLTSDEGYGMSSFLQRKSMNYIGILNGVDYEQWSPEKDLLIPANYSVDRMQGKGICKKALQERMRLDIKPDVPVIGVVSRFVAQKGLDLLAESLSSIVEAMQVQFAILGSGDKGLEGYYQELTRRYAGRIGVNIGYNNELAHLIEAGSDFFIMPSLYEPCGLNQIYSLRYGTLPIVRATGGLDDTVIQYDEGTGEGTGFKFGEAGSSAIYYAVGWAVSTYFDRKPHLERMIRRAMEMDYSWDRSAHDYVKAYQQAIRNKQDYNRQYLV